ncbi:MAG TPA: hypothetical protein VJI32_03660 [Candidatus Nanoarchaeia archaeon]|nr:hypothetical protein [Candidatus Nanoarchaeia archaeon]
MIEAAVMHKISKDLDFLKERIIKIEANVEEINFDIHNDVKPEYLQKLKRIDEGKFLTEEEFEKEMLKE